MTLLPKYESIHIHSFIYYTLLMLLNRHSLEQLASEYPEYLNIVQLDNGRFHYSSSLKIPDNILLLFQPPYSPELNPIERVWHYIKQELSWEIYENLDALKEKVRAELEELSLLTIASITGWDYILSALATVA